MATDINGAARLGFDPVKFKPVFKRRLLHNTILSRNTNNEFAGEFVGQGTTLEVPVEPLVATKTRKQGDPIVYQHVNGTTEKFSVGRQAYIAFVIEREEQKFSPIGDLQGQFMAFGQAQRLPELEREYYADVYAKCADENQGNEAGYVSGSYDLGAALTPTYIYKTDAATTSSAQTHKETAPDYMCHVVNALREQPGGENITPWIIVPTVVADRIQTSELKQADLSGDDISLVRKDIRYIGDLGGAHVYVSNLLPVIAAVEGDSALPTRYVCLAGDNSAVTYFGDTSDIEVGLKDINVRGTFNRAFWDYEWFVRYPERLASVIVAIC